MLTLYKVATFRSLPRLTGGSHCINRTMSITKTIATGNFKNEKLKDLEDLFDVDDSFGDDSITWDNWEKPTIVKKTQTDSDFKDIDDDELILLTTPKKLKENQVEIELQVQQEVIVPKKLKFLELEDEEVFFSAEDEGKDELFTGEKSQNLDKDSVDRVKIPSSWTFSSSFEQKIATDEASTIKQRKNQEEFEISLQNNDINETYRPLLHGPSPKLTKGSSKLTTSSNIIDTSPAWHRHETWLNVEKRDSSPPIVRKTRTPLLNLSSSPPHAEEVEDCMEIDEEQIMPVSRMYQTSRASDIAKKMIQDRCIPQNSRRLISSTVQTSARTRNSTIELMTQKPLDPNFEGHSDSLLTTKNLEKKVKPVILSEEQLKVVEILKQGQSLFYTGSAGTGKSILLKSLIKTLRRQHGFDCVAVSASTGLALCNIGGSTLHSLTGIGLGNGDVKSLVKKIKKSKKNLKRWKTIKVLIIDEISMIEGELLDKLSAIGKEIRKNDKPFGGIQLIVCGDFYQLPPVAKDKPLQFAFESQSWKETIKITIILKKVFRQQGDSKFVDMLNAIRGGLITEDTAYEFNCLSRSLPNDDGIDATELFPTRQEVDRANNERLNKICEPVVKFSAFDSGSIDDDVSLQRLLNNFLAPKTLQLKKGAQVMMIKNIDETLVNGSLGRVLDFIDPDTYMFYERAVSFGTIEDNDIIKHIESSKQAEAASAKVLKSEYLGDDESSGLDENIFDFFKNLRADPSNELLIHDIEHKKSLIDTLHNNSKGRRLPLVRFKLTDGNTRDVLVEPEKFEVEDPLNEHKPIASRQQLPLILAWALSIHKSQGQTLTKVRVNLQRIFEKGQAYVALSRATSRDGLQILNFNPGKIMAHPRVINFYTSLVGVDDIDIEGQNDNKRVRSPDEFDDANVKRQRQFTGFSNEHDFIQLEDASDDSY